MKTVFSSLLWTFKGFRSLKGFYLDHFLKGKSLLALLSVWLFRSGVEPLLDVGTPGFCANKPPNASTGFVQTTRWTRVGFPQWHMLIGGMSHKPPLNEWKAIQNIKLWRIKAKAISPCVTQPCPLDVFGDVSVQLLGLWWKLGCSCWGFHYSLCVFTEKGHTRHFQGVSPYPVQHTMGRLGPGPPHRLLDGLKSTRVALAPLCSITWGDQLCPE